MLILRQFLSKKVGIHIHSFFVHVGRMQALSLLYVCLSAVCCLCLSVSLLCSMQLNFKFFWNLHGFSIDCTIPSLVSSLSPNPCIFVFLYYNYSLQLFEVGLEERKLAEVSCLSCISSHIVSQFY